MDAYVSQGAMCVKILVPSNPTQVNVVLGNYLGRQLNSFPSTVKYRVALEVYLVDAIPRQLLCEEVLGSRLLDDLR